MKKNSETILIILFSVTIVFHLLVLLGLIPYDMVWGGRLQTKTEMIQFEVVSIIVNLLFLFVLSIRRGWFKVKVSNSIIKGFLWFMVGLFLLNTVGNLLSESRMEMLIFTPLTFIVVMLLLISLLAPNPKK